MNNLELFIQGEIGNPNLRFSHEIQSLWSGYGSIERWEDGNGFSVVVKHIKFPNQKKHPRGWNSNIGHERKVKSYEVENNWYSNYSDRCEARLPKLLAKGTLEDSQIIILEDLDAAGFDQRIAYPNKSQYFSCISWLAEFHACFLELDGEGLWEIGTYWHLATRPEELAQMESGQLKDAAGAIDEILNRCRYKTLVHGDAKLANFCFSKDDEVAGVDFQYVGRGAGVKDLIYFISSVGEFETVEEEKEVLDFYFDELAKFLGERNEDLEKEWRALYKYAWADFNRFLQGWSPGHWKLNDYVNNITQEAIRGVMFNRLSKIAKTAVLEAGEYIVSRLGDEIAVSSKGANLSLASSVVTEVDEISQSIILKHLKPTINQFDLGLLSEELKDDNSRFEKDYFWCVDPLDGTLPFTEKRAGFSVVISLVDRNGTPIIGVVYDPVERDLYCAIRGEGAFLNDEIIKIYKSKIRFSFYTDRSLTKSVSYIGFVEELKKKYLNSELKDFEIIAQGGATMNALWILNNAPGAYIKPPKENPGGGGIWDFAATACIFNELGFRATNYHGGKLDLNRKDSTYMNHEGVYFEIV